MPNISIDQLLSYSVVSRLVSRVRSPISMFQRFLGVLPGGPNTTAVGGHVDGWDIFDRTRKVAKGRAIESGPATSMPQKVGHVTAQMVRLHEKIHLHYSRIFRRRPLGEPFGTVDPMGQRYVAQQAAHLGRRFANAREFVLSQCLCGGKFDLLVNGDDLIPVKAGNGTYEIDFQIPAGNRDQLDMLGDGDIIDTSWDNANADVIGHCLKIRSAGEQLHGFPYRHAFTDSTIIKYLMNNTGLKEAAGTANVVFADWRESPEVSEEGIPDTGHIVVFRALPWLVWHVYDAGLEIGVEGSESFVKFFDGTTVLFLPDPSPDWLEMHEGSEVVVENVMAEPREVFGMGAWTEQITQPAGFELLAVDNFIPALYIPSVPVFGTVVFS